MSEEILKALMQLFAIIAKQDFGAVSSEIEYVKTFLTQQLSDEAVNEYYNLFEQFAVIGKYEEDESDQSDEEKERRKLTSVKDSVRILGLCKKINKTLTQKQKIVVLVRLFELINADRKFTKQRMAIINTVAEVFKVSKEEFQSIESFAIQDHMEEFDDPNVLIINANKKQKLKHSKHIVTEALDTNIYILRISSVDLYFLKYTGEEDLFLNGLPVNNKRIYLYANGSAIRLPKGKPVYYSDVASHFLADISEYKISYEVKNLEYKFPNGNIGLQNISFSEGHGKLIGIMGASGAGKTTLLNVLCGQAKPSKGDVFINGINLHTEKKEIEGVIGYIPQDDLLIEELTVFQNLYYNAKLCFKNKSEKDIINLVDKTLSNLGLLDRKDLKVGSVLNKLISGGQRKRLNIALELIREPSILFVDEPTSGLSSNDSENVMDLLRELTLKGILIFVVIHQPSSEIYKMFDKMIILDTGGYMIYYGNPVESVMYFKRMDMQINSEIGECPTCGNVNPELIFNIIEAKVVDEFGNYTDKRKVSPLKWEEHYKQNIEPEKIETIKEPPPRSLNIPNWIRQFRIYTIRDFLSKISNTQYIALNLLEAPVLGFILSYISKYIANPASNIYIFRENENIPIYIFMALIVALFLGFMVSAEEIFKDRKILKREAFLNLSRSSYFFSKILILFFLSAIQAITLVLIGNGILGIKGMTFYYWFALFSTASFANIMGLNISASFNSAVTIYIIIPLLIIPMMVLSGAMFSFDKLNRKIGSIDKVPLIAEIMPTKWSYEALMVHQFKDNRFEKEFYSYEKKISQADFKNVDLIPDLRNRLDLVLADFENDNKINTSQDDLLLIKNEIFKEQQYVPEIQLASFGDLVPDAFNIEVAFKVSNYLDKLQSHYQTIYNTTNTQKENLIKYWLQQDAKKYYQMLDLYHNEAVGDYVKKVLEKKRILEYNHQLVQQLDPIYKDPVVSGKYSIRSHFFAPRKHFMDKMYDTYWFNMVIIWLLFAFFYITLYFDVLPRLLNLGQRFKFRK